MNGGDLDLFTYPAAPPRMHRTTDRQTSIDAAHRVAATLTDRKTLVLDAVRAAGARGLTDRELETLPQFAQWGFSSARKRRSELFQAELLEAYGKRDGLTVWRVCP